MTLPALARLPAVLGPRIPGGVEPGDPSVCEATPPARCWWVDADAPAGGNGTYAAPYNSFEVVVGYLDGQNYGQGAIRGGDHLYLKGTFRPPEQDNPQHMLRVLFRRQNQGGTPENPTVIKSWRGHPRAVLDGQHQTSNLLYFANIASFRVSNLEVRDGGGVGINVESVQGRAVFEDLFIHGTVGDGNIGVGGGFHMYGGGGQEVVVQYCHFRRNNFQQFGTNNVGALSITSDLVAPEFGTLRVYRNIFEDETTGVRHKHAGNYDTIVEENLFWGGARGVWLRSFRSNDIHHNVFVNLSEAAVMSYMEATKEDLHADIHHNNIFNTTRLVVDIVGLHDHDHILDFHHNFVVSTNTPTVYAVSNEHSRPHLRGAENIYVTPGAAAFSDPTDGAAQSFGQFMQSVADTTSTHHVTAETGTTVEVFNSIDAAFASARMARGVGF